MVWKKKVSLLVVCLAGFVAFSVAAAPKYKLPQLTAKNVAAYKAANSVFFVKSDWIRGCGTSDLVYLGLRKVFKKNSSIPFTVADWNDYRVFRALGYTGRAGLNIFLHIKDKTYAYTGTRVYWSVYNWAYKLLAQHGLTENLKSLGALRAVPENSGSLSLESGLTKLFTFNDGTGKNSIDGKSGYQGFNYLKWGRYLQNGVLDIYHGYMSKKGVTRPKYFTSGLGFYNSSRIHQRGFSVVFDFKPVKGAKNEVLFRVGGVPCMMIQKFKGQYSCSFETEHSEYGVVLPDFKPVDGQWNTLVVSVDFADNRLRIRLNGRRLQDVVLKEGVSGSSLGAEFRSVKKRYSPYTFQFVYGRGGDIFTGKIENLAFWNRPLNSNEVNRVHSWIRSKSGGTSYSGGAAGGGDVPPRPPDM